MNQSHRCLAARQVLERLKRGVPPTSGIVELSVGMSRLESLLHHLLRGGVSPRWFLVQGEYGEGKSHFHAFAREQALRAGYAVASLDVNGAEGALHQPQRHLPVVLNSLRSPLPQFCDFQGFAGIFRHWLDLATGAEAGRIFRILREVEPCTDAGREPKTLHDLLFWTLRYQREDSLGMRYYSELVTIMEGADLGSKASYARFAASFRFQVVLRWLTEVGHKGLLLFVDEVDNVLRQIHGKGHPACFRSLAWYCSSPAFPQLRVVMACTPEIVHMLDRWGRDCYMNSLRRQQCVRKAELKAYECWNKEAETLSSKGYWSCPQLNREERRLLFGRISTLHQEAWNWSWRDSDGTLDLLAKQKGLDTARKWVRASVQLLDVLQQADSAQGNVGCALPVSS